MKKTIILFIFLGTCFLYNCSNDDKVSNQKTVNNIDMSDLTIYTGSEDGKGKEFLYNNIKQRDLAVEHFKTSYKPDLYKNLIIEFNGDKLTYTFLNENNSLRKVVSDYVFRNDSLFISLYDTTNGDSREEKFVALGSSPDFLYLRKTMVSYPSTDPESKDRYTYIDTTEIMNLEKVLEIAKIDPGTYTNSRDTIAWCNMIYFISNAGL
jgi:hypothetical protein